MTLIGSVGYSAAMRVNIWYNRGIPSRRGAARTILRRRLKSAVHYLVDFRDEQITGAARHRKVDGVICGHTHKPDHRMIGPILYINDGDWVQSQTALVEEMNGALRIVRWREIETDRERG
jgi:UDP-2,3-diacylglucosamine pyrophosphatase LpxH